VRRILLASGGLAVVVASFFATLSILNYLDSRRSPGQVRDATRAEHARLLKGALEKYRAAHGKFPMLFDNDVSDLQGDLVGGGYLTEIPSDPLSAKGRRYRYAANGVGSAYGLMFQLETATGAVPADGICLSRAKGQTGSFWGDPPACPF
jgi:hypothetical protein